MWRLYLIVIAILAMLFWPNIDVLTVKRIVGGVAGLILVVEFVKLLSPGSNSGMMKGGDN